LKFVKGNMVGEATRFGKGNVVALHHGGESTAMLNTHLPAAVEEVRSLLASQLPYLEAVDGLLVEGLARLLVRIRLMDSYYERLGGSLIDSQGRARQSWQLYLALTREFRVMAAALGIGPQARAALMGNVEGARRDRNAAEAIASVREKYGPKK
jgi:hypothetical protein